MDHYAEDFLDPPRRTKNKRLLALSGWYKSLDDEHKDLFRQLMNYTAEASLFSTPVILDGASLLAEELRDADLRLTVVKDGEELVLSSSKGMHEFAEDLHDLMFPIPEQGTTEA